MAVEAEEEVRGGVRGKKKKKKSAPQMESDMNYGG